MITSYLISVGMFLDVLGSLQSFFLYRVKILKFRFFLFFFIGIFMQSVQCLITFRQLHRSSEVLT